VLAYTPGWGCIAPAGPSAPRACALAPATSGTALLPEAQQKGGRLVSDRSLSWGAHHTETLLRVTESYFWASINVRCMCCSWSISAAWMTVKCCLLARLHGVHGARVWNSRRVKLGKADGQACVRRPAGHEGCIASALRLLRQLSARPPHPGVSPGLT